MHNYNSFTGIVINIENFYTRNVETEGCYKIMTIRDSDNQIVNFIIEPFTYFVNNLQINRGDLITGFFDADVPVPLIYPPQYRAIVITKYKKGEAVKVSKFDELLVSTDGMLQLNISPRTEVLLQNNQRFIGNLENHILTVVYGPTTRSIPAQTTPYQVIVMCN